MGLLAPGDAFNGAFQSYWLALAISVQFYKEFKEQAFFTSSLFLQPDESGSRVSERNEDSESFPMWLQTIQQL